MPQIHANNIEIHYEILGPGSPDHTRTRLSTPNSQLVPLVLTHGFAGPSAQWKPELLPLAEKRPLVLYDVRGHGRTSVPPNPEAYSLPTFAADLAALLKVIGIQRAHVGGVSMGGMITAQFAVDYPEMCASVLLCDTTCGNGASQDDAGDWERGLVIGIRILAESVRNIGMEETVRREWVWKQSNDPHLSESPYTLEGDLERIKLMTVDGYVGTALAIAARPDLTARIPAIKAPTLVMIGEWDDFLPYARRDHDLIPGSRLVIRKRCAHGSRWRAETFVSEIERFLNDVESGRSVAGEREI